MGSLRNSLAFFTLCLLLVFFISFFSGSEANAIGEQACKLVDCGQGTCNSSVDVIPFFQCDCYPGWTQLKLLDKPILPPCIIPNCSVDFSCGALQLPTITFTNFSDPCNVAWCGNGTCSPNVGGGHRCDCAAGAYNLLNLTDMPCFRECYLGSDCSGVGFGAPPPPATPLPPDTSNASGPAATGSSSGSSRRLLGAIGYMALLVMSLQFVIRDSDAIFCL